MSLRVRLFLVVATLVALLMAAQLWLIRSLTGELDEELNTVALVVGSSVAEFLHDEEPCEGEDCGKSMRRFQFVRPDVDAHGDRQHLPPASWKVAPSNGAKDDGKAAYSTVLIKKQVLVPNGPGSNGQSADHEVIHRQFSTHGQDEDHGLENSHGREDHGQEDHGQEDHGQEDHGQEDHGQVDVQLHVEQGADAHFLFLERDNLSTRVEIPRGQLRQRLEALQSRMLLGSAGLLAAGLLAAAVVAHRATAPLRRLAEAANAVGAGALGTRVEVAGDRDTRDTLEAFNQMSAQVAHLDAETRRLAAHRHLSEIGDIARGLAHTLRNPLNALGLSVDELAARTPGDDQALQLADSARRQIGRLDHNIRSFLVLASPGDSTSGLPTQAIDLRHLAQDVALEALQANAGARIRVSQEDNLEDAAVQGVEAELRAVLQALVINAVEASPTDEAVEVHIEPEGPERLVVVVSDRGSGLPPEVRERLFSPHLSTKAQGSGMGLFLAHRVASQRYDGSLVLEDRSGGGTCARLEVARSRCHSLPSGEPSP